MNKIAIIATVIGLCLFGAFENASSAGCKDLGIHYGSSSLCPSQSKDLETKKSVEQPTTLRLFDMRNPFNEGDPIVFVGKLTTKSGFSIPNAKITITHDGACTNKTIGGGLTDKMGRFWIFTTAKIWDKKDNLVKAQAEFEGKKGFLPAKSEVKIIVVYPVQNKSC